MGSRPRLLMLTCAAAAIGAAVVLIVLLARSNERAPSSGAAASLDGASAFAGAALPTAVLAPEFTLTDQSGRRISLARRGDRVTMLAFVSTSCAPACVLVAQQIRGALDELARPPVVLLVSADPAADTPARVSRFLARAALTGRVHFLSGPASALRAVWTAYGVRPMIAGRTTFERSQEVRLIDTRGRERVIFGLEQLTPEGLAHDVRKLA